MAVLKRVAKKEPVATFRGLSENVFCKILNKTTKICKNLLKRYTFFKRPKKRLDGVFNAGGKKITAGNFSQLVIKCVDRKLGFGYNFKY